MWVVQLSRAIHPIFPKDDSLGHVVTLEHGSVRAAASVGDALWVVSREDERNGQVGWVARIRADTYISGAAEEVSLGSSIVPSGIGTAFGTAWIGDGQGNRVLRMDPDHPKVVSSIDVESSPRWFAATKDALWGLSHESGALLGSIPRTTRLVRRINSPLRKD